MTFFGKNKRLANFEKFLGEEDKIQIHVGNYLRRYYPKVLWIHPPNEGKRSSWLRYKMAMMGIQNGAPDILIFRQRENFDMIEPNYGREYEFSGLAIELKSMKGKQTDSQKAMQVKFEAIGWIYKVFRSAEETTKFIDQYLQG